jgi:hypothetical protein
MKKTEIMHTLKGTIGITCGAILLALLSFLPQAHAKYNWLQFGFLPDKTANNTVETNITLSNVGNLQPLFLASLSNNADGAPVLLTGVSTPGGVRDLLFVFAEQGYTTAFDANTGAQVWTDNFSVGAADSGGPPYPGFCAGHTSNTSPAIDPNGLYVYTFGMDGNVHKLNVGDGSEVTGGGWPERIMNDDGKARGALTIATATNGDSYLYGNAGNTKGNMTTIDLNTGAQHVFNTANAQDPDTHSPSGTNNHAFPWSRGPAYNSALDRVFFTTGTYANFVPGHQWVESLIAIAPDGHTVLTNGGGYPEDSYTPTAWQTYINNDSDLGSCNIIQLPIGLSSKYPNLAVMGSKDGVIRIFNLANLSGQGGPGNTGGDLEEISSPLGSVRSQGTVWTDPATSNVWVFIPADGGICGLQVAIDGSGNPSLVTEWTLANGWTTSAIMANGVLFAAVGGGEHSSTTSTHSLQAINPKTGAVVWSAPIGQFHWESPIVANGIVYMVDGNSGGFGSGTGGNLRAWSLGGGNLTGINLINYSFETNTSGVVFTNKVYGGFDVSTDNVAGWLDAGTTYNNSGVDFAGDGGKVAEQGSAFVFAETGDSGAYQISGYQMQTSNQLTLTWWAKASGGAAGQTVSLMSAASPTTPFSSLTTLASSRAMLYQTGSSNEYTQYLLTYTPTSADAGKYVAVFFAASTTPASCWASFDNFALSVEGTSVANGVYSIANLNSGLVVDDKSGDSTNGSVVQQYAFNGGVNQQWGVTNVGGGQYEIIGVQSGRALSVDGGGTANGTGIDIYDYSGASYQQWSFAPTSGGYYRLTPGNATGSALDVQHSGTTNGVPLEIWNYGGDNSQQWSFQAP